MSSRGVAALLIIAVAGYALLALVYPIAAPVTKLDIKINRDQAIAIARQHVIGLYPEAVSAAFGADVGFAEDDADCATERTLKRQTTSAVTTARRKGLWLCYRP